MDLRLPKSMENRNLEHLMYKGIGQVSNRKWNMGTSELCCVYDSTGTARVFSGGFRADVSDEEWFDERSRNRRVDRILDVCELGHRFKLLH